MHAIDSVRQRGRFESLERRDLLAGDVLVNVVQGSLVIEGDELGNNIAISANAETGDITVTGLDGTTVHLEGEDPGTEVVVSGVRRDVRINLGDGDDVVSLGELSVRGDISIRTGLGEDTVHVGDEGDMATESQLELDALVNLRGSLRINTGDGNDEVIVDNTALRASLHINTGDGDDTVSLGGETMVDGTAAALSNSGNRGLGGIGRGLLGGDIDARLNVRGGAHVDLGDGNDELNLDQVQVRSMLTVKGGEGDDDVNVNSASAFALSILGDEGMDTVSINDLHAGHLGVFTGGGADNVSIADSVFFSLGVSLGDDDDTLSTDTLTARFAMLRGGEGEDTHNIVAESDFIHDFISGFELPAELVADVAGSLNGAASKLRGFGRLR
jgi:hypothetical protein